MKALHCSEHKHQAALCQWWGLQCHRFGIPENLLFAVPNGGARNVVTGAILKAEGVRRGIPDLFLAVPKDNYHGLFIEMKTERGHLSKDQKEMIDILQKKGYDCVVCHGYEKAVAAILRYLTGAKNGTQTKNM